MWNGTSYITSKFHSDVYHVLDMLTYWSFGPIYIWNGSSLVRVMHDDVIKWKHFPRYWPFIWGIHRPPVNSPHKSHWRGALIFPLICTRISNPVEDKRLSKQSWGWWFETPSRSLLRHCNGHLSGVMTLLQAMLNYYPPDDDKDCTIESNKTTSMGKESTVVLGENKVLFET